MSPEPLLSVQGLQVRFPAGRTGPGRPRFIHALNGVDLRVERGETLGLVGESGCGKSTLAGAMIGLVSPSAGRVTLDPGVRARLQMVFQDPKASLDPRLPVWRLISEPLVVGRRGRIGRQEQRRAAAEAAALVELPPEALDRFPHEFSGGQRQRIAIARALAAEPELILLDEPTSALDMSVQAQILNLLKDLQRTRRLTYVLISHNVPVIRHLSDRVAVMYLGQVVELGPCEQVLGAPRHPYTRLLLESVPRMGAALGEDAGLTHLEQPSKLQLPSGCCFRDRCPLARPGCELPQVLQAVAGEGHSVRCHVRAQEPG